MIYEPPPPRRDRIGEALSLVVATIAFAAAMGGIALGILAAMLVLQC